jgi:4-carboxymuconolactone decarboxylase
MMQIREPQTTNFSSFTSHSDVLPSRLRSIVERSEAVPPAEQALALAVAAEALGNTALLRECLLSALAHGATPLECYEALLQTYLFAGFPAALEGIAIFQSLCKENHISFHTPAAAEYNPSAFAERGAVLCETIYTNAYSKMRTNLATLTPDLAEWMILDGYGKTLAREGLPVRLRELLNVSVLAVTGWKTQLYSHLRGAMNVGAQPIECIDILNNLEIFTESHIQERVYSAKLVLETLLGRTSGNEHHA